MTNNKQHNEDEEQEGYFTFSTDSALLSELGERLVAEPSIALTELIKNTYDADSPECIILIDNKEIIIEDYGIGMSNDDFANKWMRIATSNKQDNIYSKKYNRLVTGSKGIGRFSARFLGNTLHIESITLQKTGYFKLFVEFNWKDIDQLNDIKDIKIAYKYYKIAEKNNKDIKTGTKLTIKDLKYSSESLDSKQIKTNVLKVVSPHLLLKPDDKSLFKLSNKMNTKEDPGFEVIFMGLESEDEIKDLSAEVLDNYEIRVQMTIEKNILNVKLYNFSIDNDYANKLIFDQSYPYENQIGSNVYADLRFFPRRKGMFDGISVNGFAAYEWVKSNKGITIFDKSFRIVPYGSEDDDWLYLDADKVKATRDWRSTLTKHYFPISEKVKNIPRLTPALYLPTTSQMIGAVFVETDSTNANHNILSQSMDRSGFLDNDGFKDLVNAIRFGAELIAIFDKEEQLKQEEYEIQQHKIEVKSEINDVIDEIQASTSLTKEDKTRIIKSYQHFSDNINEIEEYERKAKENIEVMGLLGTVAGFMTHEYESTIFELQRAVDFINNTKNIPSELKDIGEKLQNSIDKFNGYISYTNLFIRNINTSTIVIKPFKVKAAVKYVISTFKDFRNDRNITIDIDDIDENLLSTEIQVSIFHGIIHNLYTNALKALISSEVIDKKIKINIFNIDNKQVITVSDNGHGIPESIKKRIWDPLFTTTSTKNNPLGSGMGLGLPLLKKVVEALKGEIQISKPQEGFNTTFTIILPLRKGE